MAGRFFLMTAIGCLMIITVMPAAVFPDASGSMGRSSVEQPLSATAYDFIFSDLEEDTIEKKVKSWQLDSSTLKLTRHYNQWKKGTDPCDLLFDEAVHGGYDASAAELRDRVSCYGRAFPGIWIDTPRVNREIIIEKFLLREIGVAPPSAQVDADYRELLQNYPLSPAPPLSDIMPIVGSRALFSMDTVARLCDDLSRKNEEKGDEGLKKSMEPWSAKETAINAEAQACLATDPSNGECVVCVGEFNAYVSLHPSERGGRLDTARSEALNDLLTDYFFSRKAKAADALIPVALIDEEIKKIENAFLMNNYPAFMNDSVYNDQRYEKMYDKYYDRFFKARKSKIIGIIGSTDSLYIDSLFGAFQAIETDTSPALSSRKKAFITSLPWTVSTSEQLPEAVASLVDSLKIQGIGKTATPFGFFMCRVVTERWQNEISLKTAYQKLNYLIHEEFARFKGKPDSVRALEYYRSNSSRFLTPDTVTACVWLTPTFETLESLTIDPKKRRRRLFEDTVRFQSKIIASNDLPADAAIELLRRVKEMKNRTRFVGPFSNRWGTWYFDIKKVLAGGKKIPFDSLKGVIAIELEIQSFPFDSIFNTETGGWMKDREAAAGAYRDYLARVIKKIPNSQVRELIEKKIIKISYDDNRPTDKRLIDMARQSILSKKFVKDCVQATVWVKSLMVNRDFLFKGNSMSARK